MSYARPALAQGCAEGAIVAVAEAAGADGVVLVSRWSADNGRTWAPAQEDQVARDVCTVMIVWDCVPRAAWWGGPGYIPP